MRSRYWIASLAFAMTMVFFGFAPKAQALALRNTSNNLGLVGYWSLNDATSTKATDFSGNKNTGYMFNGPTWTASGKKSGGLSFDGTNDFIAAGSLVDNMTRANANPISASLVWPYTGVSNVQITSNAAYITGPGYAFANMSTDDDVLVTVDFTDPGGAVIYYTYARYTDSSNYIQAEYNRGADRFRIYQVIGGSQTTIAEYTALNLFNCNNIMTLSVVGTTATVTSDCGMVLSGTITGTLPHGGNAGFGGDTTGMTVTSFTIANSPGGQSLNLASSFTISTWIKPTVTLNSGTGCCVDFVSKITSESNGTGYELIYTSGGSLDLGIHNAGYRDWLSTQTFTAGTWYHIAGVWRGSTTLAELYVNGVAVSGSKSGSGNFSLAASVANLGIGKWIDGNARYFNGVQDDIRIYNRALSATEILNMYNDGQAKVNAPTKTGLVGEWSFDDATGTKATDFSGNGNTGTLTNMEATDWVNGYRGKALSFDGVDEYVSIPDSSPTSPTNITISAWIYCTGGDNNYRGIVTKGNGSNSQSFALQLHSSQSDGPNKIEFWVSTNGSALTSIFGTDTFSAAGGSLNGWKHIVATYDGTTMRLYSNGVQQSTGTSASGNVFDSTTAISIGKWAGANSDYFPGSIDDVRIYNRALSATEVQNLYNATKVGATRITTVSRNGLVGYWNLDDGTSTKATDFSGNGNTGTLTNFALSGSTSNWVTGKRGRALDFDGSDDYVTKASFAGQPTGNGARTTTAWIKVNSSSCGSNCIIVMYGQDSVSPYGYGVYVTAAYKLKAEFDSSAGAVTSNATVSSGVWHHIAATYDGSTNSVYLDGALDNTASYSSANTQAGAVDIGRWGSGCCRFAGSIDDVRIYNRALSASEVQTLYNLGR